MKILNWKEKAISDKVKLCRSITFDNFVEAVEFINKVSEVAERRVHHPDLYLHDYKNLDLYLYTHDEDKISSKDYEFAKEINEILA